MGFKPKRETPALERELSYLLYDLCVLWGFCLTSEHWNKIVHTKIYTAENFASDVLTAEEFDFNSGDTWHSKISNKFIERFGTDKIEESTFIDRIRGEKENWK